MLAVTQLLFSLYPRREWNLAAENKVPAHSVQNTSYMHSLVLAYKICDVMWCDVREVSHCTDCSGCEMCFETTPLPRLTPSKVTHQNRSTTTYNHRLPKMESFLSRCVFSALLPNGLLLWKSSWPLQQSQLYIQMSSSNGLNFIVVQKPLGTAQMCPKVLSLWPQSWFSF